RRRPGPARGHRALPGVRPRAGPPGGARPRRRAAPAHRARRAAPAGPRPRRRRDRAGDVRAAEPPARRLAGRAGPRRRARGLPERGL
ncbi:MAG: Metal-dependent hydrolase YbeY, involved in rRNA and/or ribosome maturation and assembly, partial [uncultured Pseudonocardia sp.]